MGFILFLAISLSLDALGIGAAYGVRGIIIPLLTKVILTLESLFLMGFAIFMGNRLTILSPDAAKNFGVLLLVVMGIWLIFEGRRNQKDENLSDLVHAPSSCDKDKSLHLDAKEALSLGLVLSIDSLGAGIGAGAAGICIIQLSASIALFQIFFLTLGTWLGRKLSVFANIPESLWSVISGVLLICIAVLRYVNLKF